MDLEQMNSYIKDLQCVLVQENSLISELVLLEIAIIVSVFDYNKIQRVLKIKYANKKNYGNNFLSMENGAK